jgi:tRNA pseudouridine38-40 synthase
MADPVRLRIDLAYDGAPFAGFARQPDQTTVQGTLEGALSRLTGQSVDTTCAGRTDRGVHALAQVVHVDLDPDGARGERALADLDVLADRLDHLVGRAITVWRVRAVPDAFDARFSATARAYRYRLADASRIPPLQRYDRWHVAASLSVARMRAAARHLVGEHDYASFCRKAPGRTSTRRLDAVTVVRRGGLVEIGLAGPAFCHQQVRSIVGCLVDVGHRRREPDWLAEVLEARDRSVASRVAPPHGLLLERVSYGRRWPAAPPVEARRDG